MPTAPSRCSAGWDCISAGLGVLFGLYLIFVKLVLGQNIGSRPLLIFAVLLVILGVQMISMGLLAEMIMRTYHEVQDKPIYVIRDQLG